MSGTNRAPLSAVVVAGCGLILVGIGVYFCWLRPALLPEDARYIGATLEELLTPAPGMGNWLDRVFWVLGGYIMATGVLTVYLAATAFRTRAGGRRCCRRPGWSCLDRLDGRGECSDRLRLQGAARCGRRIVGRGNGAVLARPMINEDPGDGDCCQCGGRGRRTVKVVPVPRPALWVEIRPRWASTMALEMVRPMPLPPRSLLREVSAR